MVVPDYPFLDLMWTMLIVFFWIAWLMLLFYVLADVFRRHDIGGGKKALWVIFVIVAPFLGVLVYVIVNGQGMAERNVRQAQSRPGAVRPVRAERGRVGRRGGRDRAGKGAARQRRHHAGGVRQHQGESAFVKGGAEWRGRSDLSST